MVGHCASPPDPLLCHAEGAWLSRDLSLGDLRCTTEDRRNAGHEVIGHRVVIAQEFAFRRYRSPGANPALQTVRNSETRNCVTFIEKT